MDEKTHVQGLMCGGMEPLNKLMRMYIALQKRVVPLEGAISEVIEPRYELNQSPGYIPEKPHNLETLTEWEKLEQ